jgi:hypothetical protein
MAFHPSRSAWIREKRRYKSSSPCSRTR